MYYFASFSKSISYSGHNAVAIIEVDILYYLKLIVCYEFLFNNSSFIIYKSKIKA